MDIRAHECPVVTKIFFNWLGSELMKVLWSVSISSSFRVTFLERMNAQKLQSSVECAGQLELLVYWRIPGCLPLQQSHPDSPSGNPGCGHVDSAGRCQWCRQGGPTLVRRKWLPAGHRFPLGRLPRRTNSLSSTRTVPWVARRNRWVIHLRPSSSCQLRILDFTAASLRRNHSATRRGSRISSHEVMPMVSRQGFATRSSAAVPSA